MNKTIVKTAVVLIAFFGSFMVGCKVENKEVVTTDSTVVTDSTAPTIDTTLVDTTARLDTVKVK